jgi:hypothetical protein
MPDSTPVLAVPFPLPEDALVDYPALGQELAEKIESLIRGSRVLGWSRRDTTWFSSNTTPVAATPFMPGIGFDADGVSSYLVRFSASGWSNQGGAGTVSLYLDFDGGASMPVMAYAGALGVNYLPLHGESVVVPAAGPHTVNVRLVVGAGNAAILADANYGAMILTVEELPGASAVELPAIPEAEPPPGWSPPELVVVGEV